MAKTLPFTGSAVAIVTPFLNDRETNYAELDRMIEMHIEKGTDAIVICGTTGEASCMMNLEHLEAIRHTCATVAGRIPVIAGTGSNDTMLAVMLSQKAQEYGADALLLVTPYYNKTSQRGLVKHFTTIAESVDIPCILYNVPSRTGMNISIPVLKELAKVNKGGFGQYKLCGADCGANSRAVHLFRQRRYDCSHTVIGRQGRYFGAGKRCPRRNSRNVPGIF